MKRFHFVLFFNVIITLLAVVFFLGGCNVQAKNLKMNIDIPICKKETTCKWNLDNGKTFEGCQNKTIKYSQAGNYEVSLTMQCGGVKQITSRKVEVNKIKTCKYIDPDNVNRDTSYYIHHEYLKCDEQFLNQHIEWTAIVWNGKSVCEVEAGEDECTSNGYHYSEGDLADKKCNSMEQFKEYKICRKPI